uniref:Uncharacterized protein n=1 Tax=Syphacia muris TaxID=451379 RepID=A0A0N5B0E4_9BILA
MRLIWINLAKRPTNRRCFINCPLVNGLLIDRNVYDGDDDDDDDVNQQFCRSSVMLYSSSCSVSIHGKDYLLTQRIEAVRDAVQRTVQVEVYDGIF